uniref:NADH dehydrogenase subunit 4L n=1 Tax=Typhlodromus pineus TaxID=3061201 RepID=A0AAU6QEL6_9ACAR
MKMVLLLILFACLISLIFLCETILNILVTFEFIIFIMFILIMNKFMKENIMELMLFLVLIILESILGLLMMLKLVFSKGSDILSNMDVF